MAFEDVDDDDKEDDDQDEDNIDLASVTDESGDPLRMARTNIARQAAPLSSSLGASSWRLAPTAPLPKK